MKSKFVYKLLVISKYLYILICISIPIVFIYESYQGDNVDFMIYIHAFIIFPYWVYWLNILHLIFLKRKNNMIELSIEDLELIYGGGLGERILQGGANGA